jgi:hypothetical protein
MQLSGVLAAGYDGTLHAVVSPLLGMAARDLNPAPGRSTIVWLCDVAAGAGGLHHALYAELVGGGPKR